MGGMDGEITDALEWLTRAGYWHAAEKIRDSLQAAEARVKELEAAGLKVLTAMECHPGDPNCVGCQDGTECVFSDLRALLPIVEGK
jgi:G:T-mismatch repair DNA endonuclease (very short patch repair protein)